MAEINIGINTKLGAGTNKIVFSVKQATNNATTLFTTDLPIDNLVIASIQPNRDKDKPSNIKQGIKLNKIFNENKIRNNRYIIDTLDELTFHQEYAINNPQMAPKLYKVTLKWFEHSILNIGINDFLEDPYKYLNELLSKPFLNTSPNSETGILEIFVLEERCGEGINKKTNIIFDNNFTILVNNLIDNMSNIGNTWFTDFKPENSCPLYDPSGNLTNIIALDLDVSFTYNYTNIKRHFENITNEEITIDQVKQICKDMMYLEFMFVLLVWGDQSNLKKQFIVHNLQKKFSEYKLLQIISFICYLTKYQLQKYNDADVVFEVDYIGSKFPIIYYILKSKYINNNNNYNIDINNDNINQWFINEPYLILLKKIHSVTSLNNETTILVPDEIFIEEPVDETRSNADNSPLNETRSNADNSPLDDYDYEEDKKFAYGNLSNYGGKVKKRKVTKKRRVTNKKRITKRNKKRFTKRRKH